MGFFSKLKAGLTKTRDSFGEKISQVFSLGRKIDEELFEELEEALISSDVGVHTALELTEKLRKLAKEKKLSEASELRDLFVEQVELLLSEGDCGINIVPGRLNIILVVGVNGAGKTTSIGKMAHYFQSSGHHVLLAAADTFRAAAIEQLMIWGERADVPVIRQESGSDPGAVVFDACRAAVSRDADILIVDTAGRLQNKANLMAELQKIDRIIAREAPDANLEVLLVLDAGTGQNAISQAKLFTQAAPLTGIILTKLDGTAKGGVVLGIQGELKLPVKMIGVGEGIEDLREFSAADFARALFNPGEDNEEAED